MGKSVGSPAITLCEPVLIRLGGRCLKYSQHPVGVTHHSAVSHVAAPTLRTDTVGKSVRSTSIKLCRPLLAGLGEA